MMEVYIFIILMMEQFYAKEQINLEKEQKLIMKIKKWVYGE